MISLLNKEIRIFFGSLTGYVVIFVFLLTTGLFLWVFPGNYNIPENGYATLESLFELAPWVYLFLIPAITMRMFAEERKMGTMEILLTRPLTSLQIVISKYLASLILAILSLIPTLVYFYSVYQLGNPVGSIDTGATWGSFVGLFFLAAIYIAIGLFASAITDNQIFAFIAAMAISFIAYIGFDFVSSMQNSVLLRQIFLELSINSHYQSVSRGVVDSRDLFYFIAVVFVFIFITSRIIHFASQDIKKEIVKASKIVVFIAVLALISAHWFFRIDLTSEKRYSLNKVSKMLVSKFEEPVNIYLYLDGELMPGFKNLQKAVVEKINDYNSYSSELINLIIIDPYQISNAGKREKLFNELLDKGLQPTDIRQKTDQGNVTRRIFPGAIVTCGNKEIAVNLLKNNPLLHSELNLNNSVESLEYEFSDAFSRIINDDKKTVAFLRGHDELNEHETYDFRLSLSEKYSITDLEAKELTGKNFTDVLIIANPKKAFPERDKFFIDQYLMNGGQIIWFIDPVQVSLDSLSTGYSTLAFPVNLNLDDLLFRYGVRVNNNLIQDVECILIPLNVAPLGSAPKFEPVSWYYSPLLIPSEKNVISRNINRIKAEFVSTIDTVGKSDLIRKTPILETSPYTIVSQTPLEVSLASTNNPPDRRLFNQAKQTTGVLVEGVFTSVFKNRIVSEFGINEPDFKEESKPTRQIIFSDGNLISNKYRISGNKPEFMPMGYDNYSKQTFGNKTLMLNSVNYLCDNDGILQLRSRELKIRILDKVRLSESLMAWQLLNVLLPLIILVCFGFGFIFIRKRKYGQ